MIYIVLQINLLEDESIITSRLLDKLGYGPTMNFLRKESISRITVSLNCTRDKEYILFCGSKGEGISKLFESDMDTLAVSTQIICTESVGNYVNCGSKIVFYLDTKQSSPGYTMLRLISNRLLEISLLVNENLVQKPHGIFLSAEGWKQNMTETMTGITNEQGNVTAHQIGRLSGPSVQSLHPIFRSPADNVFGIECESPSLLRAWINRSRSNSWPSQDLIKAVSETRAHVVPVGNIGSPFQLLEWWICFTEAELILIQHLKPCYAKALILLKAVTKRTLKPICKEITTYVIKNVILWIAEKDGRATAPETRLIAIFQHALKFLKSCIWKNNLPSYMIEQRNLFAGRFTRRSRLCARIDFLLKEGPRAILRCRTLKHYFEMLFHFPAGLRQELLRTRAYELFGMEFNSLCTEKFFLEDIFNFDFTDIIRIASEDKDFVLLFDRYDALFQEQTEHISEDDIRSGEMTAESCANFLRKNFTLLWGL